MVGLAQAIPIGCISDDGGKAKWPTLPVQFKLFCWYAAGENFFTGNLCRQLLWNGIQDKLQVALDEWMQEKRIARHG